MKNLTIAVFIFVQILTGCDKNNFNNVITKKSDFENPVISIPVQRNSPWIVKGAIVGGREYSLFLDTGLTWTVFNHDDSVAAAPLLPKIEAKLIKQGVMQQPSVDGDVVALTPSGDKTFPLGLTPAIRIQDWVIPPDQLALRGNVTQFNSDVGSSDSNFQFDGMLGIGLMQQLTWRVDYVSGRLMAYAGQPPAHDWKQCTFMTLSPDTRMPIISAKLKNQLIFVGIDTGNLGDMSMDENIFSNLSNSGGFEERQPKFYYDFTHKFTLTHSALISNFSIGSEKFPKLLVSGSSHGLDLGVGALSKMDRFEFDFRNYRFCFDPSISSRDSVLNAVGAVLLPSHDFYEVRVIAQDGRLALSGVKQDDVIQSVDGHPTKGIKSKDLYDLLDDPATSNVTISRAGRMLTLKMRPRNDQKN